MPVLVLQSFPVERGAAGGGSQQEPAAALVTKGPDEVTDSLKAALPVTWAIVLGGSILLFLLAVPLGTLSAFRENTWVDRAILTASIAGATSVTVPIMVRRAAIRARSRWCVS